MAPRPRFEEPGERRVIRGPPSLLIVLPSPAMTDAQLLLMIGVPALVSALLIVWLCLNRSLRLARRGTSSPPGRLTRPTGGIVSGPSLNAREQHLAAREVGAGVGI